MLCVRTQSGGSGDRPAQLDVPRGGERGEVRGTGHQGAGALLRAPTGDAHCHCVASAEPGRAAVASWQLRRLARSWLLRERLRPHNL